MYCGGKTNEAEMSVYRRYLTAIARHTTPLSPWRGVGGEASCGEQLWGSCRFARVEHKLLVN